jgi:hypothetical protein
MDTQTQEITFPDIAQVMATADMQRRMDEAEERVRIEKLAKAQNDIEAKSTGKTEAAPRGVSPRNGQPVPVPPKREAGVRNRLTNLRDAVLEAFDQVGGAQYLAKLAQGSSSDRAAFVSLVSKVLPTQINADVSGGIQVQLSWLGSRNIGATATQIPEPVTQVIDLERDTGGKYRIKDPTPHAEGGGQTPAADGQAGGQGAEGASHA